MRNRLTLALFFLLILPPAFAQNICNAPPSLQCELQCPAGFVPTTDGLSLDPATGLYRAWKCISPANGTITINDQVSATSTSIAGAIVFTGDKTGATDAAAPLNALLSVCNGQTIQVPDGKYRLNSALVYPVTTNPCTLSGWKRGAVFFRNFTQTSGPQQNGLNQIVGSNWTIRSLSFDGCAAADAYCISTFTGNDFTNENVAAANVTIEDNFIFNSDGNEIVQFNNTNTPTGPWYIKRNRIIHDTGTGTFSVLVGQGNITGVTIDSNENIEYTDCNAAGNAPINYQGGNVGTAPNIRTLRVTNNARIAINGAGCWGIQAGPFNGLTMLGMQIINNYIINPVNGGTFAGFISTPFTSGHQIIGNTLDTNYIAITNVGPIANLLGIELGGASNGIISHNICFCETTATFTFISGDNGGGNLIDGNISYGTGENGGVGVQMANASANQALPNGATTSQSTNTVTVNLNGTSLPTWLQPGASFAFCLPGPPINCNAGGYFGFFVVADGSYSRSGGTFTYIDNQQSGAATCTSNGSTCGTLYPTSSNNTVTNNVIYLPSGPTASAPCGLQIRGQGPGLGILSNNVFKNNTIIGYGTTTSSQGVCVQGSSFAQMDNNQFFNNTFMNLQTGMNFSNASTNNIVGPQNYINVTNHISINGSQVLPGQQGNAGLFLYGTCTGTVTASLTTGGIYGTGPNKTSTACNAETAPGTPGTGVAMNSTGQIWALQVTATAAGTNASSGVVTVLKNGVGTAVTCTIGTATSCSDLTHTVTYAVGDLISVQYTTQAADTLAGLKMTILY